MSDAWTIRKVVTWTAKDFAERGIDTARLDAELLTAHALGIDRVRLYLDLDRPLHPPELAAVRDLVRRRREREPVAYILGEREFYGRVYAVGPAVLVPRPDTETLVERALAILDEADPGPVLDLCTGSGIIALTLAAERPNLEVHATDLSAEALSVARANAERHGVTARVRWLEGDLFAPVSPDVGYGLVSANPPYIGDAELDGLAPEVARWEPRCALAGGVDGLSVIRRIASEVGRFVRPGGSVLVEVGAGQAETTARLFTEAGLDSVACHPDLAGVLRVVEARRPGR